MSSVEQENNKKRKIEALLEEIKDGVSEDLTPKIVELEAELKAILESTGEESEDEGDDDDSIAADDSKWGLMYRQLREYRIINGDCKVSRTANPKLGIWVKDQKAGYKGLKEGSGKKKISVEHAAKLDALGMEWGGKFPAPVSWDERFDELEKYKKAMNRDPPVNANSPTPLGTWVSAQRKEFRRQKFGKDSLLKLDQIEKLNSIGFNWKGPRLT